MRVVTVHTWHHRRGGDSVAAWDLADRLEQAGHTVARLAMRHPDNDPSPWDVRWPTWVAPANPVDVRHALRSWSGLAWNPDAYRAAVSLYEDFKPDVVHAHHIHRHLTPAVLWAAKQRGIPVVQTVHDYDWICPEGHLFSQGAPCEACLGHRYHEVVRRRCRHASVAVSLGAAAEKVAHRAMGASRWVDRFLCPSRFVADKLVRFGIAADRVIVLQNPIAVPPVVSHGQGWVFAGRLTAAKGTDVLGAALSDVPGTVLGDGPELAALQRRLPGTRFLGHVPTRGVAEALAGASVVIVPSIWWENQPYAVTEAQALGRAVVASDIGGIPELIRDGHDGILVPPNDPGALRAAVSALLAAPERAAALGAAARARVTQTLDPDGQCDAVVALYRSLGTGQVRSAR